MRKHGEKLTRRINREVVLVASKVFNGRVVTSKCTIYECNKFARRERHWHTRAGQTDGVTWEAQSECMEMCVRMCADHRLGKETKSTKQTRALAQCKWCCGARDCHRRWCNGAGHGARCVQHDTRHCNELSPEAHNERGTGEQGACALPGHWVSCHYLSETGRGSGTALHSTGGRRAFAATRVLRHLLRVQLIGRLYGFALHTTQLHNVHWLMAPIHQTREWLCLSLWTNLAPMRVIP